MTVFTSCDLTALLVGSTDAANNHHVAFGWNWREEKEEESTLVLFLSFFHPTRQLPHQPFPTRSGPVWCLGGDWPQERRNKRRGGERRSRQQWQKTSLHLFLTVEGRNCESRMNNWAAPAKQLQRPRPSKRRLTKRGDSTGGEMDERRSSVGRSRRTTMKSRNKSCECFGVSEVVASATTKHKEQ